jgi:hypothetical protein
VPALSRSHPSFASWLLNCGLLNKCTSETEENLKGRCRAHARRIHLYLEDGKVVAEKP